MFLWHQINDIILTLEPWTTYFCWLWTLCRQKPCALSHTLHFLVGPGKPAEWAEQSRMVVQTVTKTTRVTQYGGPPPSQLPPAEAAVSEGDASKVTVMGNGVQQAVVNQEAVFMVDGSKAGKRPSNTTSRGTISEDNWSSSIIIICQI